MSGALQESVSFYDRLINDVADAPPGQLKALVQEIYESVWGLCGRQSACISALSVCYSSAWLELALCILRLSPLSPVSVRTRSTARLMLALSVTLSRSVLSLGEAIARRREAPGSVRHAAITRNPRWSSCRATRFPKPLSQPVTRTCFSWMPVMRPESLKNHQTAAKSPTAARESQQKHTCGGDDGETCSEYYIHTHLSSRLWGFSK